MEKDRLTRYFFIGLIVLLMYLSFLIVKPFIAYIALGTILTYLAHPLFEKLNKKVGNRIVSSGIMILVILLVLIIPTIFIIQTLVVQAGNTINGLNQQAFQTFSEKLSTVGLEEMEIENFIGEALNNFSNFIIASASSILGSLTEIILGMFVMFFIMYYGFKEGEELYKAVEEHIPLEKKHKTKLVKEIRDVSHGVLYGQVMTAIIQGIIGGVGFMIFGIPNPVFWGFIMMIMSFLPVIGTPVVWVPAGIISLTQGHYISGIGILVYGAVLITNIDNVVKPMLISGKTNIHPSLILIGVLGGLTVFGFAGLVLGPLVISLLITMIKFYTEEKSFRI